MSRRSTWIEERFAQAPAVVRGEPHARSSAGYDFGETDRAVRLALRGPSRAVQRRGVRQRHGQHRAVAGASSPRRRRRACRCSWAATRSRPRPTSSTSSSKHKTSACGPSRPRTRSPRRPRRSAPAFGGALGVTTTSGPGLDLKAEAIGLAVSLELPLLIIDVQRGGPSTGLPTKTEQSDLLHGDVRPPRRAAAARSSRRTRPSALLRRRDRGGAHRGDLPHAGVPALRRVPRQRLGALAAARRRRPRRRSTPRSPPRRTTPTPTAPSRSGPTCATRRRSRALGAARPAGPRAPHRRHSRSPTARARSPTTRATTSG